LQFVASVYPHMFTNFGRFILIFNKMACGQDFRCGATLFLPEKVTPFLDIVLNIKATRRDGRLSWPWRTWAQTRRASVEAVPAQLGSGRRSVPCGRHRRRCGPAACRRTTLPHPPCETCGPRPNIDDSLSPVTFNHHVLQYFILNSRLGSSANTFLHRPFLSYRTDSTDSQTT